MDPTRVPDYVMSTLCRICAEKSTKLISIFKDDFLPKKICKCLPINVCSTDHLPLSICENCLLKLDESYLLYNMAFNSDQRLKTLWKILVKETLIRYPNAAIPDNEQCKNNSRVPILDLCAVNECCSVVGFLSEDPNKLACSSNVNRIPESVMFDGLENIGCDQKEVNETGEMNKFNENIPLKIVKLNNKKFSGEKASRKCENPQKKNEADIKGDQKNQTTLLNTVYQCQFCSFRFSTLTSLSIHESTHSYQKPHLCDICGKCFKHSNNLRCHARIHTRKKKKHICGICNKGFLSNFFLQEHMNSHTGETPYKCAECGKEFREKVHLRQHKWTHSKEKFCCPYCGNNFSRKGNMKEHIKKFHKTNETKRCNSIKKSNSNTKFNCSTCDINFSSQAQFKIHLTLHPEQKRFACSICGKKFRHSGSLTYHRRTTHTGEKPFQCKYCSQKFSLRSVQLIHERKIHTLEHPYKCPFCPCTFVTSSSLRNHIFIHSKNKMFECDICEKKFSRKCNLYVHKKLHSGDRKFACDQCNKNYIQKNDLLKHKKVHDPKSKPFFCKYCGNSFARKKDSSKHSMCQFDFLRKNSSELNSAEKMLDSVSANLTKTYEDFLTEKQQLLLESVEELTCKSLSRTNQQEVD